MQPIDAGLTPLSPQALSSDIERIAMPSLPTNGAGFNTLFREVRDEVTDFIANGSTDTSTPALSTEGWMQQQRLQGTVALSGSEVDSANLPEQQAFLDSIAPWAQESAAKLGVDPDLVAAHAALESGWGKKPLRLPDGQDTLNLFSIKAQGNWQGTTASALSTEFVQGQAFKQTERFRAYPDYASAFRDYTKLLTSNPRYQGALHVGSDAKAFAQGLARGGYATDPNYADKLASVAATVKARALTHSRD